MKRIAVLLVLLACAGAVSADPAPVPAPAPAPAAAAPAAPAPDAGKGLTLAEFFDRGGSLMWPLLLLSVLAVANVGYLLYLLRDSVTAPQALVNDVTDNLRTGSAEEARKACDYRKCPFSHIAMAAIDADKNLPGGDPAILTSVVEGEGSRQAARLQGRTQWLLDIASIAPMLGLLGTVIGMLTAFQGVGAAAAPVVLAHGVALALITTVAGLLVAIPCMCFYAWFRRQAARQVALLESLSADLVMLLLAQRKK